MATLKNKNENLQLKVGLFFTLGLGLTFVAIFLLGSRKGLFTDRYTIYCYFDDISGLRVGSPVQLAGIKVGAVSAISFEEVLVPDTSLPTKADLASLAKPKLKPLVKVKTSLELDRNYKNRVCTDSTASVVTEGLLGDRIIFLTVGCRKLIGTAAVPVKQPSSLNPGDVLTEVYEPKGFSNLVEQGDVLMRDAREFMRNTNTLVVNLNGLIEEIQAGEGMAHKLIYDLNLAKNLETTTENLNASTQNLEDITQKINKGQGTVGALINDASLYNELKMLLGKANRNKLVRSVIRYTLKTKEKDQLK